MDAPFDAIPPPPAWERFRRNRESETRWVEAVPPRKRPPPSPAASFPSKTLPAIAGSVFEGNEAAGEGGGLFLGGTASTHLVSDSRFLRNRSHAGGGGIASNGASMTTIDRCTFEENAASLHGGGLYVNE